jgi:uncharacterized protein YxeA
MLKWTKRILIGILGLVLILFLVSWISFLFWKKETLAEMPYESSVIETKNGPVEYTQQGEGDRVMLIAHGTPGSAYIADTEYFV